MQSTISRRHVLATAAALPVAAVPSVGEASADAELVALWGEYLRAHQATEEAGERFHEVHRLFTAEAPPCPAGELPGHHFRSLQWLRDKFNFDALADAWNDADGTQRRIIAAIFSTPAEGPLGIGIKLAARVDDDPDPEDLQDNIDAALADIARLTGFDFSEAAS